MAFNKILSPEINKKNCGECRARSDCTYVQADLALHSPHNKYMIAYDWIRNRFMLPYL